MVKSTLSACALALVIACALALHTASAQAPKDPLIEPAEGDLGSRFQVVGEAGWTPGEQVNIRLGVTPADPQSYAGPFYHERQVTVLRDGTWSFPINVSDELFPFPLDANPAYIVIRAESPTRTAVNAFVFAPGGRRPAGAEAVGAFGFGPQGTAPAAALIGALFAAATGGLLIVSGATRNIARRE